MRIVGPETPCQYFKKKRHFDRAPCAARCQADRGREGRALRRFIWRSRRWICILSQPPAELALGQVHCHSAAWRATGRTKNNNSISSKPPQKLHVVPLTLRTGSFFCEPVSTIHINKDTGGRREPVVGQCVKGESGSETWRVASNKDFFPPLLCSDSNEWFAYFTAPPALS